MSSVASEQDVHRANLARLAARCGADRLAPARERAFERFAALGFPSHRDEDWRQTNVAPLARVPFALAGAGPAVRPDAADVERFGLPGLPGGRLVFVDGALERTLGAGLEAAGLTVLDLAEAVERRGALVERLVAGLPGADEQAFLALSTAFVERGALVHVAAGAQVHAPLHLLFLSSGGSEPLVSHPRLLVVLEEGARLTLVESHAGLGEGQRLVNAVTQVELGAGSALRHAKVVREVPAAAHVATVAARVERDAVLASSLFVLDGGLVRHEVAAELAGEGAVADLDGLYVVGGARHAECRTFVDHAVPRCESRQLYKGVLGGRARGVFTGRVLVRPDAQKTVAHQTNRNLVLSPGAEADTKPQLEIYADDVKCSHGATIGRLDEEQLFYLRSRGLDEAEARDLLTRAFGGEVLAHLAPEDLRQALETAVQDALPAVLEGSAP